MLNKFYFLFRLPIYFSIDFDWLYYNLLPNLTKLVHFENATIFFTLVTCLIVYRSTIYKFPSKARGFLLRLGLNPRFQSLEK